MLTRHALRLLRRRTGFPAPKRPVMTKLQHDLSFDPRHGEPVEVAPGIRRLTVNNPGPFTFHGTNTYLIGEGEVAVLDPGPADEAHLQAILAATRGQSVTAILVSHTHKDHSPAAARLAALTGAPVLGCAPHRAARALHGNEVNPLDASADMDYRPDRQLADAERFTAGGRLFEVVETPGHTANHLAFALPDDGVIFSADHVMAWSTSIVAPPDGSMQAYLQSLDRMMERSESLYLPGHGGLLQGAQEYMAALKAHRMQREAAILGVLHRLGQSDIPQIVEAVYTGLDPRLKGAAALSVFAQLERLVETGAVQCDGEARLEGLYRAVP